MSLVRKTYKLKAYARSRIKVRLDNNKVVAVEFASVDNRKLDSKGEFSTSLPQLQEALEKHSAFNNEFYLEKTEEITEAKPEILKYREDPLVIKKLREEEEERERKEELEYFKAESVSASVGEVVVVPGEPLEVTVPPEVISKEDVKKVVPSSEVSNVQQAKEYLKKLFPEIPFRQLSNKESVLAVAAEKSIVFEAL